MPNVFGIDPFSHDKKWHKKSWVVYLIFGILLLLFIILWPIIQSEISSPHPERPAADPREWQP